MKKPSYFSTRKPAGISRQKLPGISAANCYRAITTTCNAFTYFCKKRIIQRSYKQGIYISLIVLAICCCYTNHSNAQFPLPAQPVYIHYTSYNSGLPTGMIYKVITDQYGYIWLSTDKGLIRYNGRDFIPVNTGGKEDYVNALQTNDGSLWLFGYTGHTAAANTGTLQAMPTDSIYGLRNLYCPGRPYLLGWQQDSVLMLLKTDNNCAVCINLHTRKAVVQKGHNFLRQLFDYYNLDIAAAKIDTTALYDTYKNKPYAIQVKNNTIIVRNKILVRVPGHKAKLIFNGDDFGIQDCIMDYARAGDDLYIGCFEQEGLVKMPGYFSGKTVRQSRQKLLSGIHITDLRKDYLGNLWVSSNGNGLYFFPHTALSTLYYNHETSGLFSNNVSLLQKQDKTIIVGYDEAVADIWTAGGNYQRYKLNWIGKEQMLKQFIISRNYAYLFTTNFFLTAKTDNHYPSRYRFHVSKNTLIYKDGQFFRDSFYCNSQSYIYALKENAPVILQAEASVNKTTIQPAGNNNFYTGSTAGIYYNDTPLPYLRDVHVHKIRMINNQLFFCTENGAFTIPASKDRDSSRLVTLTDEPCYDIKHFNGMLYLRTGNGLLITTENKPYKLNEINFRQYPVAFDIKDFFSDSNYLYVAGNRGIFLIPQKDITGSKNNSEIKAHILASLHNYRPGDSAASSKYSNNLAVFFRLDIPDYSNAKKEIAYRVLKDGAELYGWTKTEKDPLVSMRRPDPGTYSIEYQVKQPGEKTIIKKYILEVTPLWWQTTAFNILLVIFAIAGLAVAAWYAAMRIKTTHERKLQQRIMLYELESKSLLAQLKPHFLFNIITPLQHYFIKGDKIGGLDYVDNLSALMRSMLDEIRDKYTTLQREIAFIKNYLEIQQKRYNNCFSYRITIQQGVDRETARIPTLLLQPLVENAVEHGIFKNRNEGLITITISEENELITIRVTDNGKGLPPDFSVAGNHALAIIKERMELLHKQTGAGSFHICNNTETGGTTATLVFPKTDQRCL